MGFKVQFAYFTCKGANMLEAISGTGFESRADKLSSQALGKAFLGIFALFLPLYAFAILSTTGERQFFFIVWFIARSLFFLGSYLIAVKISAKIGGWFFLICTLLVYPLVLENGMVDNPYAMVGYFILPVAVLGFIHGSNKMLVFAIALFPWYYFVSQSTFKLGEILVSFMVVLQISWLFVALFQYWEKLSELKAEELQRTNKQLLAANKAKTTILENVSHELLTPLTSVLGFAEVAKDAENQSEVEEYMDHVLSGADRLRNTLLSILEFAKIESDVDNMTSGLVDLKTLSENVIGQFESQIQKKGLRLTTYFADGIPRVNCDKSALERVLVNILDNAVTYTERGEINLSLKHVGDDLEILVSDSGSGMSEDFLEQAYKPFKQESEGMGRSFEGVGIGLTIAKRLVDRMGGKIELHSELGQGTKVRLCLPCWVKGKQDSLNQLALGEHVGHLDDAEVAKD